MTVVFSNIITYVKDGSVYVHHDVNEFDVPDDFYSEKKISQEEADACLSDWTKEFGDKADDIKCINSYFHHKDRDRNYGFFIRASCGIVIDVATYGDGAYCYTVA